MPLYVVSDILYFNKLCKEIFNMECIADYIIIDYDKLYI